MFDIGMGEFAVIAIVAVLVLGPDKLPRAIATGMSWLRALREQAASARREIVAAAEVDPSITDDIKTSLRDISELHPRRLAASIFTDEPGSPAAPGQQAQRPAADGTTPRPTLFDPDAT